MNMHAKSSVHRQDVVQKRIAERCDSKSTHGQRNKCHLEENGMHGTEFERRRDDLPPVSIGRFGDVCKLLIELAKGKVGWCVESQG